MRCGWCIGLGVLALSVAVTAAGQQADPPPWEKYLGTWTGSWEYASPSGGFELTLERDAKGALAGRVSVTGEPTYKATLTAVSFDGARMRARYDFTPDPAAEVRLDATFDGNSASGTWSVVEKANGNEVAAGTWKVKRMDAKRNPRPAAAAVDHLLLGAADLDRGISWLEQQTGVRAVVGGTHPGRGTRNALLSLGGRQYLEIIAPDPAQPPANLTMPIRSLATPRLITWAASAEIDALARSVAAAGLQAMGPRDGSRARPDGRTLRWRTLGVSTPYGGGEVDPIPFFIEWARDSVHPSHDSPAGCVLLSFEFGHPDPDGLRLALERLGIESEVSRFATARLTAILKTPRGSVVLT